MMDFAQIKALLAPRCSVSRKRSNAELRKIGEKALRSLIVNTPKKAVDKFRITALHASPFTFSKWGPYYTLTMQ